jgi:subtilisin-like proprotein convertase family protein
MKRQILAGMMLAATCAQASVYDETYTVNTVIPNGNPVGVTFSEDVTSADLPAGSVISDLTVGLNISGGYNGGLVAYLVAPNGTLVYLLNQPGVSGSNPFGYEGSGLNVTLADGNPSIQSTSETPGVQLTGTYGAAGSLSSDDGSVADGDWTLFFANLSGGGANGELNSFTLNFTAVPEPVGLALGIFAGLLGLCWSLKLCWFPGMAAQKEESGALETEIRKV